VLKTAVDAYQDLEDDKLDELFVNQPPRTGKSTLSIFATTWKIGKDSESSNLYSAYSDKITTSFYNGCLEAINDKVTYRWGDIFHGHTLASTYGKDLTFYIDRKKHYPSVTARSIHGTLNGSCDASGWLLSDDLVSGIDEALSTDRLASLWYLVENNLLTRAKEKCKIIWEGTRWATADPIGLRREVLEREEYKDRRIRVINLPALNEKEESNFDYDYGVGYSTAYYLARRASFEHNQDIASWNAQYQQEPADRTGVVFSPDSMNYYNGELPPDDMLVRTFMAIDPAFGGGDYTSSPVCKQYTDGSVYIPDVVYDNGDKTVTIPQLVDKIIQHNVTAVRIECNKMTMSYKEELEHELEKRGIKINIQTKAAPNNQSKEARIFDKAPTVRNFYFLEENKRSSPYKTFMVNVYSFRVTGHNKHDDAPDSLAMATDFIERPATAKVEVFKRPW
jgi:predicted phage terminase large subunit-like protein